MTYIALILVIILAIFFAVAHEEQKHTTSILSARVHSLMNENAKLRAELMTDEDWNKMVDHALTNLR